MKVWAEAVITEIDRRRIVFKVTAFDEAGQIGTGTHERFLINTEKFLSKASSRGKD
jgi:predicted thioesterase